MSWKILTLPFFLLLIMTGCQDRATTEQTDFQVQIRLASEPDNLHPMFSRSSYSTQIENLIFYPLAEFDPYTLALQPLLIEEVPVAELIETGKYEGLYRYSLKIRDEAVWEDGTPVTANDYLFTVKVAFNPKVNAPSWRGFLDAIQAIEMDSQDARSFQVYIKGKNMISDLIVVNFAIFPAHVYDAGNLMGDITLDDLRTEVPEDTLAVWYPNLAPFAEAFTSVEYNRETISGAGPYRFVEWVTGQSIILEKKENWWGEKVSDAPGMMRGNPYRITYTFVPDENTALSAMKDGAFDILSEVSSEAFVEMENDPLYAGKFNFYTPSLMQFHYLELNNRDPKLADPRVRKALASILDYDAIIDNLTAGLAVRTIGPIHPSKPYYNKQIAAPVQDFDLARKYLDEAGWRDSNGDGTVDKVIDGKPTELDLSVMVSQRKEGQQIALILQQNAAKVGIGIEIETRDGQQILSALRTRDFEILPMRVRSNPYLYDPYQTWHSESDKPGGSNRSGYHDKEVDEIIERIRLVEDPTEMNQLYLEFQEELARDQPVIFLYVPEEKIIANSRIIMKPSSRRPGYFENLFELGPI